MVHPRDPYHRIDVLPTDRHVEIEIAGEIVAATRRSLILFETGLPPRFYLPEDDVRMQLLERSDHVTACPYKGTVTRYYSVEIGGQRLENVAWVYDEPFAEVGAIAGRPAFYNERVELIVDGERWERPRSPFS